MTPEGKAKSMLKSFLPFVDWNDLNTKVANRYWALRNAKKCALIAVDEIIDNYPIEYDTDYWEQVKQEIEKL
jgi:hypothetical protein